MIDELTEMNDAVADFFDRVERGYRPSRQASDGILILLDEFTWSNSPIVLLILMMFFWGVATLRNVSKVRRGTTDYTSLTIG